MHVFTSLRTCVKRQSKVAQGINMKEILYNSSKTGGFLIDPDRIFKCFQDREIQKSAFLPKSGICMNENSKKTGI